MQVLHVVIVLESINLSGGASRIERLLLAVRVDIARGDICVLELVVIRYG